MATGNLLLLPLPAYMISAARQGAPAVSQQRGCPSKLSCYPPCLVVTGTEHRIFVAIHYRALHASVHIEQAILSSQAAAWSYSSLVMRRLWTGDCNAILPPRKCNSASSLAGYFGNLSRIATPASTMSRRLQAGCSLDRITE